MHEYFKGLLSEINLIIADPLHAVRSTSTPHGEHSELLCRDFSKHGEQTFVPHPVFFLSVHPNSPGGCSQICYCCQGNSRLILHSRKLNGSLWGLESVIGDSCLGGRGGCFVLFLSLALSVPSSRESNFKLWRNSQFVNDCRWTEKKRPLGSQGKTSLEET